MSRINKAIREIDMSPIRRVFDKAADLRDPVNLSIGIPHIDTPARLREHICESINDARNAYTGTQGQPALIDTVVGDMARHGVSTSPSGVIITAGAAGALDLALRCILEPGDEIVVPDPYFLSYVAIPPLCGARVRLLDTYPDYRIHEGRLRELVGERTKAIIINTPHNPTGRVYSREEIDAVAAVAKENGLIVISDEVYKGYVYQGEHISMGSVYKDTIIIGSFSKSHAVTGWRVGYAAGPADIIQEMAKLQQFTYVCANAPAQHALSKEQDVVPEVKDAAALYRENSRRVVEGLSDKFDLVEPQGAFYAFLKVPEGYEDDEAFVNAALERNLLIVPGSAFSQKKSHVRVSFATTPETLEKGIGILREMA